MAEFCKQCSEERFGVDREDFAHKTTYPHAVVCAGCGQNCVVDGDGTCISRDCLKQHGKQEHIQDDIAMQENEIAMLDGIFEQRMKD